MYFCGTMLNTLNFALYSFAVFAWIRKTTEISWRNSTKGEEGWRRGSASETSWNTHLAELSLLLNCCGKELRKGKKYMIVRTTRKLSQECESIVLENMAENANVFDFFCYHVEEVKWGKVDDEAFRGAGISAWETSFLCAVFDFHTD